MLSYKIPAAIALLHSKLEAAEMSMRNTVEDLEFLREQITMMEVNTARVYNWDVKRRREKREANWKFRLNYGSCAMGECTQCSSVAISFEMYRFAKLIPYDTAKCSMSLI